MSAHPPITDLVAESFDHHGAIVGHCPRRFRLFAEVRDDVARGEPVEVVVAHQPIDRGLRVERPHLALECAERSSQLERATGSVAVPEGHLALLAGRRGHGDPLERDLLDPPGAGPEQEGLAGPALVDHLLVELADTSAVG